MNIYFDFEATQFSERVISIGATCEYGEFGCLVSSFAKKITPYITKLTGITKEMVQGAPTAEEAFSDLRDWLNEISNDEPMSYHCYGNADKYFLYNTAKNITNEEIATFIRSLADSLLDDSIIVNHYLGVDAIGVHKALQHFDATIPPQDHDPVNDAIILSKLMNYMENNYSIDQALYLLTKPVIEKKNKKKIEKRSFNIVVTHTTDSNAKTRVFYSYNDATQWMYNKMKKKCPDVKVKTILNHIIKATDENTPYANWLWAKQYL